MRANSFGHSSVPGWKERKLTPLNGVMHEDEPGYKQHPRSTSHFGALGWNPSHPPRNPSHLSRHLRFHPRHPRFHLLPTVLHSPAGVTWATALGGPTAGSIVLALNYWKWGQKAVAVAVVAAGFVATAIIAWLAIITPASVPAFVFLVPQLVGGYFVARWLQGRRFDAHVAAGGGKVSSGIGAAIGLGFGTLMLGAFVVWFLSTGINPQSVLDSQDSVDFGNGQEVFYSRGATRGDAQNLGEALVRGEYFDDTVPTTVWIAGRPGAREISFIGAEGSWDDAANMEYMRELTEYIVADIGGKPVTVRMLDERLYEKKRCRLNEEWSCSTAP